jgi:hypothetical protein
VTPPSKSLPRRRRNIRRAWLQPAGSRAECAALPGTVFVRVGASIATHARGSAPFASTLIPPISLRRLRRSALQFLPWVVVRPDGASSHPEVPVARRTNGEEDLPWRVLASGGSVAAPSMEGARIALLRRDSGLLRRATFLGRTCNAGSGCDHGRARSRNGAARSQDHPWKVLHCTRSERAPSMEGFVTRPRISVARSRVTASIFLHPPTGEAG